MAVVTTLQTSKTAMWLNGNSMIKNYFKITWRSLWKHKLFSFINIVGLAAGMVICIIALIDYSKAFDYDTFHPIPERTYRIITDVTFRENHQEAYASTPFPVAAQLKNNYPFIEDIVHVVPVKNAEFETAGKQLKTATSFADASFFKVFGFKMILGSFNDAPHTAVVTAETASRLFGTANAIGKILHHKDWGDFLVTGIVETPVKKSHLVFDLLAATSTIAVIEKSGVNIAETNNWTNPWASYSYALLKKGSTKNQLDVAIAQVAKMSTAAIGANSEQRSFGYRSQLITNINPSREDLLNFPAGTTYGKLLVEMGIGLITLILAGFNYVNLTLARSLTRSKEIGLRKVIGAGPGQVFAQFIVESVCFSLLALLLSLLVLELLKPMNVIQDVFKDAHLSVAFYLTLFLFAIIAGIVAGCIPARILSAIRPAVAIKGQKALTVMKGITIRKTLVVAQFAMLLTGVIFMLAMYQQQKFMATTDYGFAKSSILNIELYGTNHKQLVNELQKIPGVEAITATSYTLGINGGNQQKVFRSGMDIYSNAEILSADDHFISVMQLPLLAGKNLLPATNDAAGNSVLINEQAVVKLHFDNAQSAVGQLIRLNDSSEVRIAGVLKDFHSMSMFFPIFPMIIRQNPAYFSVLQVKANPAVNAVQLKAAVAASWKQLNPRQEFTAEWFDKALYAHHFHGSDQLLMVLLCSIVLCIACLGLLGMVTYSSEIRTKEVGVRKVMGAKIMQLLLLLSKDFAWLLVIAGCIAVPVGYIAAQLFLHNFTYHVAIGAGTLLTGFFSMLLIGGCTIVWQTFRIAIHNPVKSLRAE
jgi:putative ABC transport system permease protein